MVEGKIFIGILTDKSIVYIFPNYVSSQQITEVSSVTFCHHILESSVASFLEYSVSVHTALFNLCTVMKM
jgi:hypothetical protein